MVKLRHRRYPQETLEPDTYHYPVPGHRTYYDGLDGMGSENTLTCECGSRLYPDCDMSSASIVACFNTHRLNSMSRRQHKKFIQWTKA
jgi:hypothetical protein